MRQLILDLGNANTCRNEWAIAQRMLDSVFAADPKKPGYEIILKWQLFQEAPPNRPLDRDLFARALEYGREYGYRTTASVFDADSLEYLLRFLVPFVKIACRRELYPLIDRIKAVGGRPYASFEHELSRPETDGVTWLCCVPEYPAKLEQYSYFKRKALKAGVSDHTDGLGLVRRYQPAIWEKHYVLHRSESNPDAGPFAITPRELREYLEEL